MLTDCGNSSSTGEFSDLFERKKFVNKRFKKWSFENQLLVTNKQIEFESTSLDPHGNQLLEVILPNCTHLSMRESYSLFTKINFMSLQKL